MRWTRFPAAAVVLAAFLPGAARPAPAEANALELTPSLRRLLDTGAWDATPKEFRIVTLSFLADGCVAEARRHPERRGAARACVLRCLRLANRTRRRPPRPERDDGLWLTHYALVLGAADALGPCPDPRRHAAIASALARRSLADPHRHVASYARRRNRWPADQAATLASLARYDRAHGARLHEAPARAWREYVLGHALDRKLGLPWSEVTGADRTAREPRGCALSWQTRYLHEVDDALARRWWTAYRRHYLVARAGLAGFREWPPGRDHGMDGDSGPIVGGVGAAATGLGVAAARVMGDEDLARRLERTAVAGELLAGASGAVASYAHLALSDAIRYVGAQVGP